MGTKADTDHQEESITVLVVLKDGSIHKFGNVESDTFYDSTGGFYSITSSQSNESCTFIFPMSSINYIKRWVTKEETDGN